jgi:lipopolysaccharide biosynthesis glycosyltransferase
MASDDNYLPYLVVAVKSISMHSSDEYVYDVRVLNSGLSNSSIRKLRHLSFKNVQITLIDVERAVAEFREDLSLRLRDCYSEAIFYRMFIASMFPRMTKAIYIDCDVVLVDDIAKLYFTDIGDNVIGAVADESIPAVPEFCDYVNEWVGVPADRYINSGVLLMNLSAFRKYRIAEKFKKLLISYNFDTLAPDQDYINFLCRGKIHYLDSGWNKQPKEDNYLPLENQHLIHYNLYNKPWHYRGIPYEDAFWNVARLTPYYSDIVKGFVEFGDDKKIAEAEGGVRLIERASRLAKSVGGFFETLGDNFLIPGARAAAY